ncbi:dTDP-4-keto-6-deoxy-D-glucose epimerase [Sphingomonas changnyeongensis]|uniref:dTDP-4-dehydrorhamnose 3,5-epimerase n=1 Tax=Sphingomonas changnyeongensis TaxID=2698679 RepID=A0A7Z2NVM8_9SPHN|nr:dTDP-4-dehydrorhamnose 3,5-epimerase family protein [Sphingomonas changnyeongensis]QHL90234.1 dTDP-4-keto-6-deoxy-D-glucose epimerase [Sphingomonas changnyeongensis]
MRRLTIGDTPIAGVKTIDRQLFRDERGHFGRLFCAETLAEAGWPGPVVQINESWTSRRGSLRGMHYQIPPHAESKLVTCIRGAVMDVAVDLRHGSPTLLGWHAETLSAENGRALLLPPGCAHGFQALTDDVLLVYCHSAPYVPAADAGVQPLDPRIGIRWPVPIADLSERDRNLPSLPANYLGVRF